MFSGYCEETGKETLMGPRRILAFHNTETGVEFDYLCVCGARGRYHARHGTGRHRTSSLAERVA